jgi:hypothetical protein
VTLPTHAAYSALNQCAADDMSHKPSAWPPPLRLPSQLTATNCQSGLTKRAMQWRSMTFSNFLSQFRVNGGVAKTDRRYVSVSVSASHFIIRGCLLSVPYRKALPNMGRAFQFIDHRDGIILN